MDSYMAFEAARNREQHKDDDKFGLALLAIAKHELQSMHNFFLVRVKPSEKREKHTISVDDLPCLGVIVGMYS
jgi:hypothetical protein